MKTDSNKDPRPLFQQTQQGRVPHWEFDPARIQLGIELEIMALHKGRPPSIAQAKAFFRALSQSRYTISRRDPSDGEPLQVNRELGIGYVAIKNDYCTNIIEFALPPTGDPTFLTDVLKQTLSDITSAATATDVDLIHTGFFPVPPEHVVTVPGQRLKWLLERPIPQTPLSNRHFAATICATHFHLNVLDATIYQKLSLLYRLEYLVPLLFSQSRLPSSNVHCMRPLIYRDNFFPSYKACGFPEEIPTSQQQYEALLEATADFQRDYSFIAPRSIGTLEFRSACCQTDVSDILELAAFRIATLALTTRTIELSPSVNAQHFYSVCEGKPIDPTLLNSDYITLKKATDIIPESWRPHFRSFLCRIERYLNCPGSTQ